ncbi:DUF882 domain-containing protein [Acidipila sp. EB88]|uniref:YcbK family protein n=1 Tax=Acidipila sp. EB88 TaxID=2305226 RepID=UPI000F5FE993|nr:DUF882 domain-containing protein [Acidipila sp. EB88]RRA50178.1 DUF882 domain-containing protein [Acidipila sp. EB88]
MPKVLTLAALLVGGTLSAGTAIAAAPVAAPGLSAEMMPSPLGTAPSPQQQYHLHMHHLHTGESLDVTYRVGNQYVPSALAMLNHFLRDHRTGETANYDPHEFDVLHAVMDKLHRPNGVIDIVCGYRSPWSNNYLRTHTKGVAEHSQHMLSKAIDIRVPGVPTRTLDLAALSLGDGGVGYYPHSQFVHVDVGPVRKWTLM